MAIMVIGGMHSIPVQKTVCKENTGNNLSYCLYFL